jgi:hypothetical protein
MAIDAVIQKREPGSLTGICSVFPRPIFPRPIICGELLETPYRGRAELILLVEDEAFVRKGAAEVLEAAGYHH